MLNKFTIQCMKSITAINKIILSWLKVHLSYNTKETCHIFGTINTVYGLSSVRQTIKRLKFNTDQRICKAINTTSLKKLSSWIKSDLKYSKSPAHLK